MLNFKGIAEDDAERVRRHFLRQDKAPYFDVTPQIHLAGVPSTVTIRSKKDYIELQGTYLVMVVPYYEYEYIPFEVYRDKIRFSSLLYVCSVLFETHFQENCVI